MNEIAYYTLNICIPYIREKSNGFHNQRLCFQNPTIAKEYVKNKIEPYIIKILKEHNQNFLIYFQGTFDEPIGLKYIPNKSNTCFTIFLKYYDTSNHIKTSWFGNIYKTTLSLTELTTPFNPLDTNQ